MNLLTTVIPPWARWLALLALAASCYSLGRLHEARHDAEAREADASARATQVVTVVKKEVQVVTQTETVYRDRIQKIYVQEKQLEADIPTHISIDTDRLFAIPAGFLRVAGAGWDGTAAGPADDSDSGPSGLRFSELARIEVSNAASCRIWREQALGWRVFYAGQQIAINGKVGGWFHGGDDGTRDPQDDQGRHDPAAHDQ